MLYKATKPGLSFIRFIFLHMLVVMDLMTTMFKHSCLTWHTPLADYGMVHQVGS